MCGVFFFYNKSSRSLGEGENTLSQILKGILWDSVAIEIEKSNYVFCWFFLFFTLSFNIIGHLEQHNDASLHCKGGAHFNYIMCCLGIFPRGSMKSDRNL